MELELVVKSQKYVAQPLEKLLFSLNPAAKLKPIKYETRCEVYIHQIPASRLILEKFHLNSGAHAPCVLANSIARQWRSAWGWELCKSLNTPQESMFNLDLLDCLVEGIRLVMVLKEQSQYKATLCLPEM